MREQSGAELAYAMQPPDRLHFTGSEILVLPSCPTGNFYIQMVHKISEF